MAKYKIIGADKDTGIDLVETVTADNGKEAAMLAQSRGMVITSVEQVEDSSLSVGGGGGINIVNQATNTSPRRRQKDIIHEGGGLYALLSFFWPGLGQICKGQVLQGILWMVAVFVGYCLLVVPGIVLHIWCMVDANRPIED